MTPRQLLLIASSEDAARVLLTFYDDATGERTELSVATFANWVAKTANLLVDGLGAEPGRRVALHLPVHWQSAVWLSACWATGLVAAPGAATADIAVISAPGRDGLAAGAPSPVRADEIVSMGLGPLGLPRRDVSTPPYATLDYDREVHAYGDRFTGAEDAPERTALELDGTTLSAGELGDRSAAAVTRWELPPRARILCAAPLHTLDAVLAALLVPLGSDAAAVLTRNLDPAKAPGRVAQDLVVAANGLPVDVLPELRRVT